MGVFQPLDLRSRTPNLRSFSITRQGSQVLYATSQTKRPDDNNPFTQINGGGEQMPRVNIKNIQTYNITSNGFSKAADEFVNPGDYLDTNEVSALRNFYVYDNDSLGGVLNFAKMTNIRNLSLIHISEPTRPS